MDATSDILRIRLLNRCIDLFCDATVVALLLVAVKAGLLDTQVATATIGFALRALVHPSLSLGVFTRAWPQEPRRIRATDVHAQ